MKHEDILNLMTELPPDLIEGADLQPPAKRRLPRLARTGIIAACLCLALIGTAFAVTEMSKMRVNWGDSGIHTDGYSVEFAVDFYPPDSFTQEVFALADPSLPHKYFDSWAELQAFTGVEIVRNPVLDNAEPGPQGTQPWDRDHPDQGTAHLLLLPVFAEDEELTRMQVISSNLIDGFWVTMFEGIYTQRMEGALYYTPEGGLAEDRASQDTVGDGMHARVNLVYGEGCEVTQETYTTPNGLTALMILASRPGPKESTLCSAYFLIDGAYFQLVVGGKGPDGDLPQPEPGQAIKILKTVLDAFEYTPAR